jgi:hypothetical protein
MANRLVIGGPLIDIYEDVAGDLILYPTRSGEIEARDLQRQGTAIPYAIAEMLEYQLGNGWNFVSPEDIGAMTEAPIISNEGVISAGGVWEPYDSDSGVWAHTDYVVEDPIEEWARGRAVKFSKYTFVEAQSVMQSPAPKPRTERERLRDFFFGKPGSRKSRGLTGLPSWRRR